MAEIDAVDSGAVLELPALAQAGTGVQSHCSEIPVTRPVKGEDMEMENEPVFKLPTKRKLELLLCGCMPLRTIPVSNSIKAFLIFHIHKNMMSQ